MAMFDTTLGNVVTRPAEVSFLTKLMAMIAVRKQRIDLANLTPSQLADIGISTKDALHEVQKPLWDVPSNWRA